MILDDKNKSKILNPLANSPISSPKIIDSSILSHDFSKNQIGIIKENTINLKKNVSLRLLEKSLMIPTGRREVIRVINHLYD